MMVSIVKALEVPLNGPHSMVDFVENSKEIQELAESHHETGEEQQKEFLPQCLGHEELEDPDDTVVEKQW